MYYLSFLLWALSIFITSFTTDIHADHSGDIRTEGFPAGCGGDEDPLAWHMQDFPLHV